jgi:hypothetical protein
MKFFWAQEGVVLTNLGEVLTDRPILAPCVIGTNQMSHSGRKSLRESTTVALNPSLNPIVFVGREVVGVAENDIAKCLLAHDGDVIQL